MAMKPHVSVCAKTGMRLFFMIELCASEAHLDSLAIKDHINKLDLSESLVFF